MPSRRGMEPEVEVDGGVPLVTRVPKKSVRTITVFQSPGLEPDARLIVFKREFHVHSVILKLHSDYFRKFLNSTGEPDPPPSTTFRYDYVSVVSEDDNTWILLPAVKASKEATKIKRSSAASKLNVATEVEAFRKLLCAMYNRPYSVQSIDELNVLTRQSEVYCAIPIVSATLTGGLMGSPIFRRQISENRPRNILAGEAPDLLLLARKLRHPVLFRECFVHLVGNWQEESTYGQRPFRPIREDPVLYDLVCQKYMETCSKVLKVNHALFTDMMKNPCQERISFAKESFRANDHPLSGAQFYKEIHRKCQADARESGDSALLESLNNLMENNLVLDRSGYGPGEGAYASNFLCANISDDEMPWDTTEVHW